MEYAPDASGTVLRLLSKEDVGVAHLSERQEEALAKAHALLGYHAVAEGREGTLSSADLCLAIKAVIDDVPSSALVQDILSSFSSSGSGISLKEFRRLLTCGRLHPQHKGRYWVAVSLAEAETIRRILHVRRSKHPLQVIASHNTELALHYSPSSVVLDASPGWRVSSHATKYEAAVAHNCFRFFDCDMHFSLPGLNILVRELRSPLRDRIRFFAAVVGHRRRMERKWQETPLVRVFSVADEVSLG